MNTKRLLAVLLCLITVVFSFVACSSNDKKDTDETHPNEITTDEAVIFDKDAIDLIKSYSAKELGLTEDEYKECSFMIAESGTEIDGKYYIKVIATEKIANEPNEKGEVTYSFNNKGEYYISYDGKTILQKDMKAEEPSYSKMKVKEVPTTEKEEKK